jgi:hypothetical protein
VAKSRPDSNDSGGLSTAMRAGILAMVCVVAASASLYAVLRSRNTSKPTGKAAVGSPASSVGTGNDLLFRTTALDHSFGTLAVVPRDTPTALRHLASLECDRVDFEGGRGLCLSQQPAGLVASTVALVFDKNFHVLHKINLAGLSSRVRVSPDGRYGATTTFVSGDSYADQGFSTRTTLVDMRSGQVLFDLEKLAVTKDGHAFQGIDFNYWGVTFIKDSTRFYATLGTGSETYLIEGDTPTREAHVVRSGVECPSLSPDGTRIAFKKRNPGTVITWRISVLDLSTLKERPLAETRNVDDQVEWLDNNNVTYGLPENAGEVGGLSSARPGVPVLGTSASLATDTWKVPADGTGQPKMLIKGAWSAVPITTAALGSGDARSRG